MNHKKSLIKVVTNIKRVTKIHSESHPNIPTGSSSNFKEIQKNILRSRATNFFSRRSKLKPRYSWDLNHTAVDEMVLNLNVSSVYLKRILFWNCHREVFGSREVTSAIIKHFWEVLIMRLSAGESFNFTGFSQSMFLTQDHDSYFISPHKDVSEKFVTNLFYISSKENENVLKDS